MRWPLKSNCLSHSLVSPSLAPPPQSGEVWYEVAGELSQEGLRPVTPDQEALQEVLHSHEEKAEHTLRLQVSLRQPQYPLTPHAPLRIFIIIILNL